jgi:hypothetical protein
VTVGVIDFEGVFEAVPVFVGVPVVDADLEAVCDEVAVIVPDFDAVFEGVIVAVPVIVPEIV